MRLKSNIPTGPLADKWDNYKAEVKLVSPANKRKFSVIVVGSGLAGASAQFSNVAYGAHVGGFLTGMLLAVTAMAIRPERFAAAH